MKNSVFSSPSSTPPRTHRHTFSESMMEENIDSAETMIKKWDWDSTTHQKFTSIFSTNRNEAQKFLEAVTGLQNAMHFHVKQSANSMEIIRAQNLMKIAVKRLEKEFHTILSANRKNLDSVHSSSVSDENSEDETAMNDLKRIADCMIGSGYAKECVSIYKLIRKSIVDETLYNLRVEKFTISQIQKMEWNLLESKIKNWLHAVKVAVKNLFSGERILVDYVFSTSENIAESCFAEISREAAVNLFNFPQNFAKSKKILSPEKMFRGLDMYEAVSDLWPEIESIFDHESMSAVRSEAVAAMVKLGEAVRIMFGQFEAAIQKDSSTTPPNGGVHPLTRYVMNFLIFLGDYSGPVSDILADFPVTEQHTTLPESYFLSPTSGADDTSSTAITTRLAWLILVLLCKLDGKAVQYNDVALSYLFLANNLNYVVSKVRSSTLGILMGPDWIWTHGSKVKQYMANYERMGWSKVLTALTEDSTVDVSDRIRRFYFGFEEAYKKQSSWVIPDPKLRDEVKISLSKKIVPSYRVLYQKYRGIDSTVRYAPEDLDNYLSDMFFANAGSGTTRASSHEASTESSISSRSS